MEEKILFFIDEHYAEPISLDTVAASVGFSKYYLSRQFKQMTKYSFCDYLNRRRVEKAVVLLTNTNLSVTEIALQSGFQSIASFNRIFKQVMLCTPKEYRACPKTLVM